MAKGPIWGESGRGIRLLAPGIAGHCNPPGNLRLDQTSTAATVEVSEIGSPDFSPLGLLVQTGIIAAPAKFCQPCGLEVNLFVK